MVKNIYWHEYWIKKKCEEWQKLNKIITEVPVIRPKAYTYLDDDGNNNKKAKGTKKYAIKQKLTFQNFKDCQSNNKNVYRSQQKFKSYNHVVYTEEVNKVALSSNDDKRIQTSNGIETYRYGTNACKVCESEMLNNERFILWKL